MCGLKRYTDWECGRTGQPSAASEQSSLTLGVGSNMTSKNGSNVAARGNISKGRRESAGVHLQVGTPKSGNSRKLTLLDDTDT